MNKEILEELGLTPGQARVYLTLVECGETKVGDIIEKSRLQSSTVHHVLRSLIEKGFVSYTRTGKMKLYLAADPRILLQSFRKRILVFEEHLPELELLQEQSREKPKAIVYEGMRGMYSLYDDLILDAKAGDCQYFFSADLTLVNEEINLLFKSYDLRRIEKGIETKGVARENLRNFFTGRQGVEVRFVDYPLPSSVSMCNGKIALAHWSDKPMGVLVWSPELFDRHIAFFNEIWEKARP